MRIKYAVEIAAFGSQPFHDGGRDDSSVMMIVLCRLYEYLDAPIISYSSSFVLVA